DPAAHVPRLRVVQELLRDTLVPLEERHADQDHADDSDDQRPARPAEYAPGCLLWTVRSAAAACSGQDLHRGDRERGVCEAAGHPRDARETAVVLLAAVTDPSADQTPKGVAGEA